MIRTAIIGRGMASRIFHAPLIKAAPDLQLERVVGRSEVASVMEDPHLDLIVIATPHDTHTELAARALQAGKHVVIDKPFVLDPHDGEALISLAAEQGRMLSVFQNRRWDGDFLTVAGLLSSGRLGAVESFEAAWDRFRPAVPAGWREMPGPGAGTLWNLGPHLIDQMILLFGMPDAVEAEIGIQRPGAAVDDFFSLTFHFGSMRARLAASNLASTPRARFSVRGAKASFVKYGLDPQEERLAADVSPLAPGFGDDPADRYGWLASEDRPETVVTSAGCYLEFYRGVARAIHDGAAPPVDPREALAGVRLLLAARLSSDARAKLLLDRSGQPI